MTHKKIEMDINKDLSFLKKNSKKDYKKAEVILNKTKGRIHKIRNR